MNNKLLKLAYMNLLNDIDITCLENPETRKVVYGKLSGLFLPSVSENYSNAKNKVMIIGSETAGWEPLAKKVAGDTVFDDFEPCKSTSIFSKKCFRKTPATEAILSITSHGLPPKRWVEMA